MYVKTNRKDEEDEERKRRMKRRGKKSPRPTYKADRRIKLSRAVKARARYLRSDWSAAVHLWRPPLPPPRSPPVLSFSSFPIADVVPAEGDLSSARTRCRGYSPCFFSRRLAIHISLFFSLGLASPGFSLPFSLLFPSICFYALLLPASRMQPFARRIFPPRRMDLPLLFLRGMTLG